MKSITDIFWNKYLDTIGSPLGDAHVEISIAGNIEIADELLNLFLQGKKTAGSGLVKDFILAEDDLPKVGNYWMILDSKEVPRCIVKTVKVERNLFKDISCEIAKAEGEGDLSVEYWKKVHRSFFTPYLEQWGITNLDEEEVVTEFFELVYKE
ncbi:ASCH domain-containing protein [Halobacteriovorax sp. HLS]|uniref:ASCH domain-containing protein n=1 Tax=Halobacteriovorax sp. HLS TaxID=2234000 RepID=UPI000FD71316|nr:ASCH domain-containing protein [Halobacteriovorax sp. HLS]